MSLGKKVDRYAAFGLGLATFGGPFAVYSFYVLLSVPLTALGLSFVVLGLTAVLIPETPVPAGSIRAMVEGACVNVEALLEEFDAKERAVYLPPRDGRVYAYVPLKGPLRPGDLALVVEAPLRVVTEVRGEPGLMIFPPGSEAVRLAALDEEVELKEAISYVLVDFLEAVESAQAMKSGGRWIVQIKNPRVGTEYPRFAKVLGSLPTSIAGCVSSQVLGKPVVFVGEETEGDSTTATFEVQGDG